MQPLPAQDDNLHSLVIPRGLCWKALSTGCHRAGLAPWGSRGWLLLAIPSLLQSAPAWSLSAQPASETEKSQGTEVYFSTLVRTEQVEAPVPMPLNLSISAPGPLICTFLLGPLGLAPHL